MYPKSKIILVIGLVFFLAGLALYLFFDGGPKGISQDIEGRTSVKVYFSNKIVDPNAEQCDLVSYVKREVQAPVSANEGGLEKIEEGEMIFLALKELLKGPTDQEIQSGFYTSINEGVEIESIYVENGQARIEFNEALNQGVAGSCRVIAIRSQIEKTVLQFPRIEKVIISINGNSEEILQP